MPTSANKRPRNSRFRWAVAASALAHCGLLAAAIYVPYRIYNPPPQSEPASDVAPAADPVAAGGVNSTPVPAGVFGGSETLRTPEEELDRNFHKRLQESIETANKTPEGERKADLKASGETLAAISSEESIDEIADKFQQLNATPDRATEPAQKPVAGAFDFGTAQIHDVTRTGSKATGYQYQATLLDAAGRTHQTPMPAADGATMYDTMQMVKQNPLMEKVYRQIMMPMLDQMIQEKQAETPAEAKP